MIIERIELENWLSYPRRWPLSDPLIGSTDSRPAFDLAASPLTLIEGENGAGKSALFDAICFALFGKYPRAEHGGCEYDAIRSGENRALVRLFMSVPGPAGTERYCIERVLERKGDKSSASATIFEVRPDGSPAPKPFKTGPKNVKDHVEHLLGGMDYDAFVSTVLLRQDEAGNFMEASAAEQRKRLLALCRLDIYDQLYAKARRMRLDAERKVEEHKKDLEPVKDATPERVAELRLTADQMAIRLGKLRLADVRLTEQLRQVTRAEELANRIEKFNCQLASWEALMSQAAAIRYAVRWMAASREIAGPLNKALGLHTVIARRAAAISAALAAADKAARDLERLEREWEARERDLGARQQELSSLQEKARRLTGDEGRAQNTHQAADQAHKLDVQISRTREQQTQRRARLALKPEVTRTHTYAQRLRNLRVVLDAVLPTVSAARESRARAEQRRQAAEADDAEITRLGNEQAAEDELLAAAEGNLGAANDTLEAIEAEIAQLEYVVSQREDALAAQVCPQCGTDMQGSAGDKVRADSAQRQQCINSFREQLPALIELRDQYFGEVAAFQTRKADRNGRIIALRSQAKGARGEAERIEGEVKVAMQRAGEQWRQHLTTWNGEQPAWLVRPKAEVRAIAQQELDQLTSNEDQFTALSNIEGAYKADGARLEQDEKARTGYAFPAPVTEQQVAELKQAWQEIKQEREQTEALIKIKQPDLEKRQLEHARTKPVLEEARRRERATAKQWDDLNSRDQNERQNLNDLCEQTEALCVCHAEFADLVRFSRESLVATALHPRLHDLAGEYAQAAARAADLAEAEAEHNKTEALRAEFQVELDGIPPTIRALHSADVGQQQADVQAEIQQLDGQLRDAERLVGQVQEQCESRARLLPLLAQDERDVEAFQIIETELYPGSDTKSPGALRASITEKLMQRIAKEATLILESLDWPIGVQYAGSDGGFTVTDRSRGGAARRFAEFSGGERFAIAVAVSLATGQVTHGTGKVRCLFIDEGFGALDRVNRGRIVAQGIGRLIQGEHPWRDQVVIITHLEDIQDQFPCRIRIGRAESGDYSMPLPIEEVA